jgi:hypothetical protein
VQGSGSGDTIEQVATMGLAGTAVKVVVNVFASLGAVAAPILDLRWRGTQSQTDTPTRAGSNDPDKNYTGLGFAIGAVNAGSGTLEGFSSAGPVDLVLTTVCPGGIYPCPGGGVAGPAPQQFQGLDFLGADGVSVSGVGGFGSPFSGTSAAAPHTAGCDALVRELIGATAAPAAARARLASTAVDFGPPGEDPTNGAGLVDCFAALLPPKALCQNRLVPTDPGVCSAASVSIDNGSFDPDGGPVVLAQSPPGPYGLGATLVTLTVTDLDGFFDTCQATVNVVDTTPPEITSLSTDLATLWPPNHTMRPVTVSVGVSDICDPTPVCQITSVASNEAVDGKGDGATAPDWQVTGDFTVDLRAERSGRGDGRTYTVAVSCTDDSANIAAGSVDVRVPHDRRK